MFKLALIRRVLWVAPFVIGVAFIGGGAFMFSEGRAARSDVRTELAGEKITTSDDAAIPGVLVQDYDTARAQSQIILAHSLRTTEGKTYAELERTDPRRTTYMNGVTLRSALNLAALGFKVSDLVMGLGVFMVVLGASHVLVFAPALYWLGAPAAAEAPAMAARTGGVRVGTPEPTAGG